MKRRLLLFAGTTEARVLCEELADTLDITACVATDYGKECLRVPGVRVLAGRLDAPGMAALLRQGYELAVDATHPYAVEASRNIRIACEQAGVPCLRLLREESPAEDCLPVQDALEAAALLEETQGNILLATGAKELEAFCSHPALLPRLYPRVLPVEESLAACRRLGCAPGHIIALQGPFGEELNRALLRQYQIAWMVTKDGGAAGGLPEKLAAAHACGVRVILIRRPQETGMSCREALRYLRAWGGEKR